MPPEENDTSPEETDTSPAVTTVVPCCGVAPEYQASVFEDGHTWALFLCPCCMREWGERVTHADD